VRRFAVFLAGFLAAFLAPFFAAAFFALDFFAIAIVELLLGTLRGANRRSSESECTIPTQICIVKEASSEFSP
jgi:hypothetical protein